MWNIKLITKIFKVLCLIGLILLLMNSCVVTATSKEELINLDKSQYFSKTIDCVKLRAKYEKLLLEHEALKTRHRLLQKLDLDKQRIIKQLSERK